MVRAVHALCFRFARQERFPVFGERIHVRCAQGRYCGFGGELEAR